MYYFLKSKIFKVITLIFGFFFLSGFRIFIFYPAGKISITQYRLIFISFMVMLIVVLPVIFMSFFFFYKYRASNIKNTYSPNWSHSKKIEFFVWLFPIVIVIFLGIIAWKSTHELDPKKSIFSNNTPIKINVVALDWKWLFIYPQEHIATINEIVLPCDTPIIFNITSHSVMSSFFIPSLGSQIYAMPGMQTSLNLISHIPGKYDGFSSNYNGFGFSNMKFSVIVPKNIDIFYSWVNKIKHVSNKLNTLNEFNKIVEKKNFFGIQYFSTVDDDLFKKLLHQSM